MLPRRLSLSCAVVLVLIGSAPAQSVNLSEGPLVGKFFRLDVAMKLTGKTKVRQAGEVVEHTVAVDAQHDYLEKIVQLSDGIVNKSVRTYRKARALLRFGDKELTRSFRPERTLLVTQRIHGQNLTYCPSGSLTRDELELTEHFNTLALTGLLPNKEVKPGDTWPVPKNVVQALCGLEGLVGQELNCKLEEVKDNVAHVKVAGSVNGIDLGVEVKIAVQASYLFDLREKRLTLVDWTQKDHREQGPACPALSATVETTVRRSAVEQPLELGDVILAGVLPQGKEPPPELTLVSFADPARRFEIQYGREWIMTAQTNQHLVWRLMNRGDLVAQVTVTPWARRDPGKMMTFDDFRDIIGRTAMWKEDRCLEKEANLRIEGNSAYRYSATGKLDGNDVVQYFYVIASPRGEQLVVTFTLRPTQVKELRDRNDTFIRGISFPTIDSDK